MIPHNKVLTTEQDIEALVRVGRSNQLTQGPEVEALEAEYCAYTGRKYAVAVGSGLAALRLALLCRRDLIPTVPAYSCVALANAAYSYSAKLGIADALPLSWTLDPSDIGESPGQTAVVTVNTFGVKAPLPRAPLLVIEDCTHGFGDHRSDIEVLSLHATKLVGGAAGGMILTDVKTYADQCRDRRDYDDKASSGTRLNDKMSDIHAALARAKLARLPELIEEREEHAAAYRCGLEHIDPGLLTLPLGGDRTWYRFVIRTKMEAPLLRAALHRKGVGAELPIEWWPDDKAPYPAALNAYRRNVSLPLYPGLSKEALHHVCKAVSEIIA
jgi:dTDP-4-amino-4,6-dideoxygalactose transaminase